MRKPKQKPPPPIRYNTALHVPAHAFPNDTPPAAGFWLARTVLSKSGGQADIGIKIAGEEVFTWPVEEVRGWIVNKT